MPPPASTVRTTTLYQGVSTTDLTVPPSQQSITSRDFKLLDGLNRVDREMNGGRQNLALTIGVIVLFFMVLGAAGALTWYFTRSSFLDTQDVLGSVKLNVYSLSGAIFTKGASDEQFVQLGQVPSGGSLTFSRYCTMDTARSLLRDERYRYLCLLYSGSGPSSGASTPSTSGPDYRLLIQVNPTSGAAATASQQEDFDCYDFRWDFPARHGLMDCFSMDKGHVYGGGQRPLQQWPSSFQSIHDQTIASDPHSPTGFTNIVVPYWLFTTGITIMADSTVTSPLSVRLNSSSDAINKAKFSNGFCLGAPAKAPPPGVSATQTLAYTVCIGSNMTHAHRNSIKKYQDPTAPPRLDESPIRRPVWTTLAYGIDEEQNLDQSAVQYMAETLEDNSLPASHIIIDPRWESQSGEAEFQPDFFPNPRTLFDTLRAKQMTPRLMLHPFMAANTTAYNLLMRDPATRRYLVASQTSAVPATDVTWWMDRHAAMLDLTKSAAVKWHRDRTRELLSAHGLHGCWFLGGASGWPKNGTVDGKFSRDLQARFADSAAEICGDSVVGETSGRFDRKIVRIADDTWEVGRSSEESLQRQLKSVIPTALTASLLGHPVFVTSMIGGNPFVGADGQLDFQNAETKYPSPELYLRWLGAVLFFPILQFSIPPTVFPEADSTRHDVTHVLSLTKNLLALRQNHTDYLVSTARASLQSGVPMIRPLWWSFPTDRAAWTCDNQYFVGDDLLVAPLVVLGVGARGVYLPKGRWRSGFRTSPGPELGPKWVAVAANLDEVPHYWRENEPT